MVTQLPSGRQWALLSYRVPRNPSTPRIAIWRRLKGHGVVQMGDGLVALPYDSQTKEQLEWVAAMVLEAGGEATVWVAVTGASRDGELVERMNLDRDAEYEALLASITEAGPNVDGRSVSRFRRELRRIERRDHFRSSRRDEARLAVQGLAASSSGEDESAQAIGDAAR